MQRVEKSTRSRQSTCDSCKGKHRRCDDLPSCAHCTSDGIPCVRSLTYKLYEDEIGFPGFLDAQKWFCPPIDPQFLNETKRIANNYIVLGLRPPLTASDRDSQSPQSLVRENLASQNHTYQSPLDSTSSMGTPQNGNGILPRLPELGPSNTGSIGASRPPTSPGSFDRSDAVVDLMPLRDVPTWPLPDPEEQNLFDYFVKNLAIWLDLCDPVQRFQKDVPERAKSSQILLNAIFALSARHLNLTSNYEPLASNRYHNQCLSSLRKMMSDAGTFQNASLFAATIILRVLEEIEMPVVGSQVHLSGIKHFVDARDHSHAVEGGLSEACFWVGLRQEIYSAVTNHKPIQLSLSHYIVDRSTTPADDFVWANRAVVLCADVINLCFTGFDVPKETWKDLTRYSIEWRQSIPPSSCPTINIAPRPRQGIAFTEIKFPHGSHVIGHQHHLLACILLSMFNPFIPRFGPGRKAAVRQMEADVMDHLRELCGIGVHNSSTPPALFTASMGIGVCGDLFEERKDRMALLDVLVRTEREHARPTAAIQEALKKDWGWID